MKKRMLAMFLAIMTCVTFIWSTGVDAKAEDMGEDISFSELLTESALIGIAELQSRGLVPGRLIYVEDMATNNVLRQLRRNREIEPGVSIESETVIDLVLGLNPDSEASTYVPDLLGKRYMSAVDLVHKQTIA